MAGQSFLALVGGKFARIFALQASAGSTSAGAVVALNASGLVDQTMLGPIVVPRYTVAALAGDG